MITAHTSKAPDGFFQVSSNVEHETTGKVRSNSHTGQYAGSISPDHSQGQTLVEPLALPGVARHINKLEFLHKTTQKRGSTLAIHTSGLNCHWLCKW